MSVAAILLAAETIPSHHDRISTGQADHIRLKFELSNLGHEPGKTK
jgi:hypothetical protein